MIKDGTKINVTSKTANEYTHPKKQLPATTKSSKLKAATELDNLLSISEYQSSNADDGRHPFAKDGWDYYKTVFKVGDNVFTGLINIGKSGNKKTLYDITKIKRIDQNRSTSANAFTTSLVNSTKDNISQSDTKVKSNTSSTKYSISKTEKNTNELDDSSFSLDSQGRKLSKEQQDYFKDSKVKDIYINEFIKGGNSSYFDSYTDYSSTINEMDAFDWVEGEDLKEWLEENHPEYDGLILDEGGTGGYGLDYEWRGMSYISFYSNQIKNVNNINPTSNEDIRYSLSQKGNVNNPSNSDITGKDVKIAPVRTDVEKNLKNCIIYLGVMVMEKEEEKKPKKLTEEEMEDLNRRMLTVKWRKMSKREDLQEKNMKNSKKD